MATLTINTTGAQDARIAAAWGARLGLGGPANAAQVKAAIIDMAIRSVVQDYEQRLSNQGFAFTALDPT